MKVNLNLDVSSTKPNWHQRTLRLELICMGFDFSELGLAYKTRSKLEANT